MCFCALLGPFFVDDIKIMTGFIVDDNYHLKIINENFVQSIIINMNYLFNIVIFGVMIKDLSSKFIEKIGNIMIIALIINSINSFLQFLYFSGIISINQVPVLFYTGNYAINHRSSGLFEKSFFMVCFYYLYYHMHYI